MENIIKNCKSGKLRISLEKLFLTKEEKYQLNILFKGEQKGNLKFCGVTKNFLAEKDKCLEIGFKFSDYKKKEERNALYFIYKRVLRYKRKYGIYFLSKPFYIDLLEDKRMIFCYLYSNKKIATDGKVKKIYGLKKRMMELIKTK